MQVKSSKDVINVAIVGTGASGKTSLVEGIAYVAGLTTRLGSVQEGNTISDYNPDEIERQISINSSVISFNYNNKKINLIDVPGYPDFVGELVSALAVVENCVLMISGDSDIDAGTINVLEMIKEKNLPFIVFVNKLDKENLELEKIIKRIEEKTELNLTPITIPVQLGANIKEVINFSIDKEESKKTGSLYEKFVENVISNDEKLMEKYLNNEKIDLQNLSNVIRTSFTNSQIVPLFCGSATKLVSVKDLLDFICLNAVTASESPLVNENSATPLALVFKTTSEPGMGQMNYVKMYYGKIRYGTDIYNITRSTSERIGQLVFLQGKKRIETEEILAGDIGAIIKLKETRTNDLLGDKSLSEKIKHINFPEPLTEMAVVAKSKGEEEKIGSAFSNISLEEPTIKFKFNPETRQMVVSGMGTLQLDIIVKRVKSRYNLDLELSKPKIPYKETVKGTAQAEGKYKKQSGGRGQYGHCFIKIEPLERGKGFEFVDKIFGGAIPKNYIPSVEKGIVEKMAEGIIAGYPVVDIRVTLYDGSYHEVDSSDMAFRIAGRMALTKGFVEAKPCILEPIMDTEILVPDEYLGNVMGDINSRRGRIISMDKEGKKQRIKALIPLAEMHAYAMDLRSITKGSGKFTMKLSHYEELPAHLAQPLIDEFAKSKSQSEE
jgi:elongation factor G